MELFSGGKQRIVLDRERGDSLQAIGERRGISYQRVQTIVRDARAHIDKIEMDLLVARNEAVAFGLAIPNQDPLDRAIALDYLQWVLTRLRSRPRHRGDDEAHSRRLDRLSGGQDELLEVEGALMSVIPAIPGTDKRARLKEAQARKRAFGDALAEVKKDRDAVKVAVPTRRDGSPDTGSREFRQLTDLIARVSQLEAEEKQAAEQERQMLAGLAGLPDAPAASNARGWDTAAFLADPEVRARLTQVSGSSVQHGNMGLGELASKERLCQHFGWASKISAGIMLERGDSAVRAQTGVTPMPPTGSGRVAPWVGVLPAPRRALRLLDLVPAAPAENNLIPYTQEVPTDAAAETPEGTVAPGAGNELCGRGGKGENDRGLHEGSAPRPGRHHVFAERDPGALAVLSERTPRNPDGQRRRDE